MGIVLGLLGALAYGASDFIGGLASRRIRALTVVVGSQAVGLVLVLAALPIAGGLRPGAAELGWGAAAGLAGGLGVTLLYRGLAIGRMSVVAPVTGVLAAALPVFAGLALGERPSPLSGVGVAVALLAIVLVSSAADPSPGSPGSAAAKIPAVTPRWRNPGMLEAIGAGAGFGLFFVLLAQAGDGSAIWPLLASKAAALALLLAGATVARSPLLAPAGSRGLVLGVGALETGANALYLLSTRYGLLSLVAVVASLYPAGTIVLARLVLRERLTRLQVVGLLVAAVGVMFITAG